MPLKVAWFAMLMLFAGPSFAREAAPRFEDYPATNLFKDKPAALVLTGNPKTRLFRTHLRRENAKGPNFAGRYRLAVWDCGSSCAQFAIVDCKTGSVHFSEELPYVTWSGGDDEKHGLEFQAESRLLIVRGTRQKDEKKGAFYYLWKDGALKLLHSDLRP